MRTAALIAALDITVVLHSLTLSTTPLPETGLARPATKLAGRLDARLGI